VKKGDGYGSNDRIEDPEFKPQNCQKRENCLLESLYRSNQNEV
jgi:hypothetical protein